MQIDTQKVLDEEFPPQKTADKVADKPKAEQSKQLQPVPLSADERGQLIGSTLEEQFRLATAYSRSGLMPVALNTPEKVLVALQLCRELGLPPMSSVGKIAVINGTPSLFGDLPLALVMRSGKLIFIKEEVHNDDKGQPYKATCNVIRLDHEPITREFTWADAKQAGLIDKNKSIWKIYPKRMLQMRARSWALKDAFPDVLSGISIAEYDHDVTVVDGEVVGDAQTGSLAQELNKTYGGEDVSEAETDSKPGASQ